MGMSSFKKESSALHRLPADSVGSAAVIMTGEAAAEGLDFEAGPEWSEVPADVLRMIAGMVVGIEDYVSFGAVCKPWRHALSSSCAADFPSSSKRHLEYPWLMLAEKKDDDDDAQGGETKQKKKKKREFYSFYSGRHFALEVPDSYGRTCFGSSSGWLLTYGLDQQMHLLNPLTRRRLLLPAATTFVDPYSSYNTENNTPEELLNINLDKVVIVTCTPDRVPLVFVIHGEFLSLAMAKPGDASWTRVEPSSFYGFRDIALFDGQILALKNEQLYACDLLSSVYPPCLEAFHIQPPHNHSPIKNLVDLGGELHLFDGDNLHLNNDPELCLVRASITVHRLNNAKKAWEQVSDIGDWTVFLGRNSSFALRSSDYPQFVANSIYFTDEDAIYYKMCGGCNMGIYSFQKNNLSWSDEDEEDGEESEEEGDEEEEEEEEAGAEGSERNEQPAYGNGVIIEATVTPFPVTHDLASPFCPPLLLSPSLAFSCDQVC